MSPAICASRVWATYCFHHTEGFTIAKYYIQSGSLQLIYSTSQSVFDACRTVLWECNENDTLDEYFYIDERGFRGYVSADGDTMVVPSVEVMEAEGWV